MRACRFPPSCSSSGSSRLSLFGMPSEHAAFFSFFACAMIVALSRMKVKPLILKPVLHTAFATLPLVVGWSRVSYGVHTVEQVAVGTCIGVVTSLFWTKLEKLIDLRRLQKRVDNFVSFQTI
eukprot:GEMP01075409.1.p2 GENE.GEMP01075409.1~~GEMP01075409.1.p2  ORF type:complete len:122 (+),score=26.20 GEMP01075409.1:254-619(+)